MTCLMDEERALDIVYFCFTKTFDTLSHNILIDKLMKHGLDKWAVKGTENWLNCWAQRFAISSVKSSWRPALYPVDWYCGQHGQIPSLMICMMGQSTTSANLQITQNWENCLINYMAGLHLEKHHCWVKKGDPSSLLSSGEAYLQYWALEKRKLKNILRLCVKCVMGGSKDDTDRFLGAQRQVKRQWTQMKYKKIHLNFWVFFIVRVVECMNRLSREMLEPPSLEKFKTWIDNVLSNLLYVPYCEQWGWNRWIPILWFYICVYICVQMSTCMYTFRAFYYSHCILQQFKLFLSIHIIVLV